MGRKESYNQNNAERETQEETHHPENGCCLWAWNLVTFGYQRINTCTKKLSVSGLMNVFTTYGHSFPYLLLVIPTLSHNTVLSFKRCPLKGVFTALSWKAVSSHFLVPSLKNSLRAAELLTPIPKTPRWSPYAFTVSDFEEISVCKRLGSLCILLTVKS